MAFQSIFKNFLYFVFSGIQRRLLRRKRRRLRIKKRKSKKGKSKKGKSKKGKLKKRRKVMLNNWDLKKMKTRKRN